MSLNLGYFVFHNEDTAVGEGNVLMCDSYSASTLTLEIVGTATSSQIQFEGAGLNSCFVPIESSNISTANLATETTGMNEMWQLDISGLTYFRANITNIVGGNISITGKVVG